MDLQARTPQSAPVETVEKALQKWAFANVLVEDNKSVDHHWQSLKDWQAYHWKGAVRTDWSKEGLSLDLSHFRSSGSAILGPKAHRGNLDPDELSEEAAKLYSKLLKPLGWFVSSGGWPTASFAPMKQKTIDAVPRYLYHFSWLQNKDKILRKGLIPASSNDKRGYPKYGDEFRYPERVHVFSTYDLGNIRELALMIQEHDKGIAWPEPGTQLAPIIVFKIDTHKLKPGTKFYPDHLVKDGLWTYTHIPPQALSISYEDKEPTMATIKSSTKANITHVQTSSVKVSARVEAVKAKSVEASPQWKFTKSDPSLSGLPSLSYKDWYIVFDKKDGYEAGSLDGDNDPDFDKVKTFKTNDSKAAEGLHQWAKDHKLPDMKDEDLLRLTAKTLSAVRAYADYVRAAAFKIFGKGVGIDPSVGTKIVSGERIVHIVPPTSTPLAKHKQFAEMLSGIASVDHSSPDPDFKKNAIKVVFKKNVKS